MRMFKKTVQQGRSRWKHRRRSIFHPPIPSCQDSSFPKWATLRMLSRRERRLVQGASRRARVGRVRREDFSTSSFTATCHVVDERPVDVGATDADGIEEVIVIRHKVLVVG